VGGDTVPMSCVGWLVSVDGAPHLVICWRCPWRLNACRRATAEKGSRRRPRGSCDEENKFIIVSFVGQVCHNVFCLSSPSSLHPPIAPHALRPLTMLPSSIKPANHTRRFIGLSALLLSGSSVSAFSVYSSRRSVVHHLSPMSAAAKSDEANGGGRNIVVVGGGIQGTSVAFHLHQSSYLPEGSIITILESQKLASAASGKGEQQHLFHPLLCFDINV
jgi:hypothetical protein